MSTKIGLIELFSGWKVRWGMNRNNYKIDPGLYAVGEPNKKSPVLVTANYKLTFDKLRKDLKKNSWILVLDTKGINVWCAAGKGTFGTRELMRKIKEVHLTEAVDHRELIIPQLGATGISAHIIMKVTGFIVNYGPVLARDIPDYLKNGKKKTARMRKVPFQFIDRLAPVPMEIVGSIKLSFFVMILAFIIGLIELKTFQIELMKNLMIFLGAILSGTLITLLLLPYIPFRSFALKGYLIGIIWTLISLFIMNFSLLKLGSLFLIIPTISSFLALNFTGASTYTSISGVKKEVKK